MAYFQDLSEYEYWHDDERMFGRRPILNVGWMEHPHPLPTGAVPAGFGERLTAFCARERLVNFLCGVQSCDFCRGTVAWDSAPRGNGEIRVLGKEVVYAAPMLIGHYVTAHDYRPPQEFIEAVLEGPGPDAREHVRYRFHCWEAYFSLHTRELLPRWWARSRPRLAPGLVLGPLILRMRLLGMAVPVGAAIAIIAALKWPWFALAILLALSTSVVFGRRSLKCPLCRQRMSWPLREPRGWSRPPRSAWEHPFGTIFCDNCDIALRDGGDPWRATGEVVSR